MLRRTTFGVRHCLLATSILCIMLGVFRLVWNNYVRYCDLIHRCTAGEIPGAGERIATPSIMCQREYREANGRRFHVIVLKSLPVLSPSNVSLRIVTANSDYALTSSLFIDGYDGYDVDFSNTANVGDNVLLKITKVNGFMGQGSIEWYVVSSKGISTVVNDNSTGKEKGTFYF
jgi:hypothetical protein